MDQREVTIQKSGKTSLFWAGVQKGILAASHFFSQQVNPEFSYRIQADALVNLQNDRFDIQIH
jgi:hypothetical protein